MWRAFIAKHHTARSFDFAFCFAHQQHFDPRCQAVDFLGLSRHGVRQVVGSAHQMRDAFFEGGGIHVPQMCRLSGDGKRQ